jgi:C1A family cysteine protease
VTSVDFRPAQSPVRNQGARGSCVAFAVSAAHDWLAPITARSTEDALWAAHQIGGNPTREPTRVQFALEGLTRHGHASEAAWPYGSPAFPADRPAHQSALELEILPPWQKVPTTTSFAAVVAQLVLGVAFILTLEHNQRAWMQADQSGVVDAPPGSKTVGRHAVLAVGASAGSGDAHLVIKNSWGDDWADGGYARLSQRYFESYLADLHAMGM